MEKAILPNLELANIILTLDIVDKVLGLQEKVWLNCMTRLTEEREA